MVFGGDTVLYRGAVNTLKTDGELWAAGAIRALGNTNNVLSYGGLIANYTNATNQWQVYTDGKMYFGSANDTSLYRSAANTLKTDGGLQVSYYVRAGSAVIELSDKLYFGAAADCSIYRAAAGAIGMTISTMGSRMLEVGGVDSGGSGYRMLRVAN